jgi:pantetheine-phosphate adenylyltransferase
MSIAIYPGSFDPITKGHIDIIKRSLCLFDNLVVAIGTNKQKNSLFTAQEKVELIKNDLAKNNISNVEICVFKNTLAEFSKQKNIKFIVRGLRNNVDYVNEMQASQTNYLLNKDCDTIFFPSKHNFISSSIIKEVVSLSDKDLKQTIDLSQFISENTRNKLIAKFK